MFFSVLSLMQLALGRNTWSSDWHHYTATPLYRMLLKACDSGIGGSWVRNGLGEVLMRKGLIFMLSMSTRRYISFISVTSSCWFWSRARILINLILLFCAYTTFDRNRLTYPSLKLFQLVRSHFCCVRRWFALVLYIVNAVYI